MLKKCHYRSIDINLTKSCFMVLVVIVVASGFGIHKNAFSLCSQIVHLNKFRKNEGLWKDTELL